MSAHVLPLRFALGFDPEQATAHLSFLHGGLSGFRDLRTLPALDGAVRWPCATLDEALKIAERATRSRRNVYVGVATRGNANDGGKGNLVAARALWCDIDDEDVRPTLEGRLAAFGVEPSLVIWSGHGAHVYFALTDPFDLSTPPRVAHFERLTKRLGAKLAGDPAATDAARILRLAGSVNFKAAPVRCEIRGWTP